MIDRPFAAKREAAAEEDEMDFGAFNWITITVIGVALLAIAIAVAKLTNRSSKEMIEKSEKATHDLYEEEDRVHRNDKDSSY